MRAEVLGDVRLDACRLQVAHAVLRVNSLLKVCRIIVKNPLILSADGYKIRRPKRYLCTLINSDIHTQDIEITWPTAYLLTWSLNSVAHFRQPCGLLLD